MIEFDDFARIEMRVGRILAAEPFPEARRPAYRLRIDFGPEVGERASSAQLTVTYPDPGALVGRLGPAPGPTVHDDRDFAHAPKP